MIRDMTTLKRKVASLVNSSRTVWVRGHEMDLIPIMKKDLNLMQKEPYILTLVVPNVKMIFFEEISCCSR